MAGVRDDRREVLWRGSAPGRRPARPLILMLAAVIVAIGLISSLSRRQGHRPAAAVAEAEVAPPDLAAADPAAPPAQAAAPPEVAAQEPATPAAAPSEESGPADAPAAGASRDQAEIARIISDGRPAIETCYQHALTRDASLLQGKMKVRVKVAASGRVDGVKIVGSPAFRAMQPCLQQAISGWTFPAASQPYRAEFPLAFRGKE